MRWFCVSFATLVVVSTALSRAGSPLGEGSAELHTAPALIIPIEATAALSFDVADVSSGRRINQNGAWSATLLLGLPFLIRRRRERLG